MFEEVLDYSLRGCGSSLERLKRSRRFHEILDEVRKLDEKKRRKTLIHRKGTRAWSCVLNEKDGIADTLWGNLSGFPAEEFAAEERALIVAFGERLLAAAKRKLPRKVKLLAKKWSASTAKEQRAIIRTVLDWMYDPHGGHILVQQMRQRAAEVLPDRFRWPDRKRKNQQTRKVIPNCVGKTLLMWAFFDLCGAECYSSLSLENTRVAHAAFRADFYRSIQRLIRETKAYASRTSRANLRKGVAECEDEVRSPSWLHGTLMVRLRNKKFAFVDPNFFASNYMKLDSRLAKKFALLETHFDVAPGAIVTIRGTHIEIFRKRIDDCFEELSQAIPRYLADTAQDSADFFALEERVLRSGIFKSQISTWIARLGNKIPSEKFPDLISPTWAGLLEQEKLERITVRIILHSILWERTDWVKMYLKGRKRKFLNDKQLAKVPKRYWREVARNVPIHAIRLLILFEEDHWKEFSKYIPHPLMELGMPSFQLACAVLGHVGVTRKDWEDTESVLARHCSSQFRLFYHALTLLGREDKSARFSAEVLSRLPDKKRTNSVRKALPKILESKTTAETA